MHYTIAINVDKN